MLDTSELRRVKSPRSSLRTEKRMKKASAASVASTAFMGSERSGIGHP